MSLDYSSLTGESDTRSAEPEDEVYSGATIVNGEATAQVIRTGAATFFGQNTSLIKYSQPASHVDHIINVITLYLISTLIFMLGITVIVTLFRTNLSGLFDLVPLLLLLLASAVPVALPTMFSMANALGCVELAKMGILLTRLNAIEDAGRMNVLCVDKTGTLTENRLSITAIHTCCSKTDPAVLLHLAVLASQVSNRDPIDLAFLKHEHDENVDIQTTFQTSSCTIKMHITSCQLNTLVEDADSIEFLPFHPSLRRYTVGIIRYKYANTKDTGYFIALKGSVLDVCELCEIRDLEPRSLHEKCDEWASNGWRSLAIAVLNTDKLDLGHAELTSLDVLNRVLAKKRFNLVGLVALSDPLRTYSAEIVDTLMHLGVRPIMLTGDALPVARQIGNAIGLSSELIHNWSGGRNLMSATETTSLFGIETPEYHIDLAMVHGFAGISPRDKHYIVSCLQKEGYVVGMYFRFYLLTTGRVTE